MKETEIIGEFAAAMHEKISLRKNRYQPMGWTTMDRKRLVSLLEGEIAEFKENPTADEAVDIANYAMFLWYHAQHPTA